MYYESRTQKDAAKFEAAATEILLKLGIPAHIKGYHYLRTAILMSVYDVGQLSAVTKILYPNVAKEHNTTASRVERAMRHAIGIAWTRADINDVTKFFGCSYYSHQSTPTNSEFIALAADKLRLMAKSGRMGM